MTRDGGWGRLARIFVLGLVPCAVPWSVPRPAAAAEEAKEANPSRYADDLAAFFKEMDSSYPFFDVKGIRAGWAPFKEKLSKKAEACTSDGEFIGIVWEAISYLRDGHMGIIKASAKAPPGEPEYTSGVAFMPASKDRVVVMSGAPGLPSALKPGAVVSQIDGKPARKVLEDRATAAWEAGGGFSSPQRARLFEYRIPLRGKKDEAHKLTVLDRGRSQTVTVKSTAEVRGWPHTYNMPPNLTASGRTCQYGKLASGVGYIYLRSVDGGTGPGIEAALKAHPDAKGWIVDLRGNGGGGYDEALLKTIRSLKPPMAVIIDAGCVSAGETFIRDVFQVTKARIFGSTSAGASSAKRNWTFPSGIATLVVATRSRVGIKGPIEFNGIKPDEEVEAVPEEVARGANSEILRAEEFLLKGAAGGGKAPRPGTKARK
jgi:C-terminal processing protease CtpA/Prc